MKFGKSKEVSDRISQDKIIAKINGIYKFAWWPIRLYSGEWLWFEPFYAYYHGGVDHLGVYYIYKDEDEDGGMCNNHIDQHPRNMVNIKNASGEIRFNTTISIL